MKYIETDKLFKNCFRNLLQSPGQSVQTGMPGCFEKIKFWQFGKFADRIAQLIRLVLHCQRRQLKNSQCLKKVNLKARENVLILNILFLLYKSVNPFYSWEQSLKEKRPPRFLRRQQKKKKMSDFQDFETKIDRQN